MSLTPEEAVTRRRQAPAWRTFKAPGVFAMLRNDQCDAQTKQGTRCTRYSTALFIREAIAGFGRSTVSMCDKHARAFMADWRLSITPVNERSKEILRDVEG